jgi:co-chaperonin GroES (HSP10)
MKLNKKPTLQKPKKLSWSEKQSQEIELPAERMFYDNILVLPIDPNQGDLINIPMDYNDKYHTGVVIMAGPGRILESGDTVEMPVEKWDIVAFEGYSAKKWTHKGNDFLIIRQDDLKMA